MEGASKGAKEAGGLVVGILPQDEASFGNDYLDVVISTGIGYARNFVTAYSCDAVVIVGGGIGTLVEAGVAYMKRKPIVSMLGSGGVADKFAGEYLDERRLVRLEGETDPVKAIEKALSLVNTRKTHSSRQT